MQAVRINPRSGQPPTDTQRRGRKTFVKRVLYLAVAALVAMLILLPPTMAQGEQAQERVQQAQERVEEAQAHLESPEGQQALEEARAILQQALQQMQGAVQEKKQEVTAKIETTKGLPSSGGAEVGALVAPAAALLVGGAVLGYAVLRRR